MNSLPNSRHRCASSMIALLMSLGLGANTALAAFNRVDNFNSGTTGAQLSTYNSKWAANADFKITVDPLNAANKVGSLVKTGAGNNDGTAIDFGAANYITVGNTGTVFFRVMVGTTAGTNFGMYLENGIGTDTSKRQASTYYNTATSFVERGASSNTQVNTTGFTALTKNVWYDFWYVAINTSTGPTFKVYAAKEGATPIAQTLLSNTAGSVQTFMNGSVGVVLQGLMFLESSGGGTTEFYFDDIFVDPTNLNLTNPSQVASADNSTVAPSPSSVAADGNSPSTVTVTLKDSNSAAVPGKTVTLTQTSGPGSPIITTTQGTTDASGVATFTVKSSSAGADVFTATDTTDSVTLTATATVTFTAGAVTAAQSTVTASLPSLPPDGSTTSTVTVTLKDVNSSGVSGKAVTLAQTSGPGSPTITTIQGTTDASGVATFTVMSTTSGADVFTATDTTDNVTVNTTVTITFTVGAVTAAQSTVTASPLSVPADGSTASTVTVTLKDSSSNVVPGKVVTLAQTSGPGTAAISTTQGTTDSSGVATFTVTSIAAGADAFTATDTTDSVTVALPTTVTFTAGAVTAAQSMVTPSSASVVADGSTTSTVTVTLKDANSNGVPGKSVTLAQTSGPGMPTVNTTQGTTDSSGVATFTVKSITAGADVFTATDTTDSVTVTPTATVTFTAGAVSEAQSTVSPSPSSIPADGSTTSTIAVTLNDANSNPVAGKTVTLASNRGPTDTVSATSGASNSSGVVTFTVKSSTTGTPTFTATDTTDSVTVTQTATVTFTIPPLVAIAGVDKGVTPATPSVTIGGSPSATGGVPPYNYNWSPTTDLDNPNSANPTASPTTTTAYILTVTDSAPTPATAISSPVTVTFTIPPLVANAGIDETVTPDTPSVTIGGSPAVIGGVPPYTYSWSPTDGLDNPNSANPSATPGQTRTYTLTVTDSATPTAVTSTDSVLVTYTAPSGFSLVENFNTGTTGTQLSMYNPKWAANPDFTVAVDPQNPANMVGSMVKTAAGNNDGTAIDFGAANYITVGNKGTVFFRAMVGTTASTNFGMYLENDISTDTSKRQASVYYQGSLNERGGSSNSPVTTSNFTSMTRNVWYDFWYVASNTPSGPTFKVYAAKEGASPIAQTLLSNAIGPVQTFMNSSVGVMLKGLMFLESSGGGTTEFYFDDIYVDPTGQNLTNPIAVVAPYNAWAQTNITAINSTADATATGDPDGDGVTNLAEFAFHGDPLNGANTGYQVSAIEDTDSDALKELTLTLAVRNGSGSPIFTGSPSPTATVDDITYTIEGSLDLNFPNSVVTETAAPTGLPALPTGWEYRRFRLDASNGLPGKGFLRAKITQP